MPAYSYRCQQCQTVHAAEHSMQETLSPPCPQCGGFTERVIGQAPRILSGGDTTPEAEPSSAPKTAGGCSWHCNHDHH